jgi:hypothetical protein
MKTCPKCGFKNEPNASDCLKCGVIFAKAKGWRVRPPKLHNHRCVFAVPNRFPLTEGHLLSIPERHTPAQARIFFCSSNPACYK